jgi:hypothetical protein
MFGCYGNQLVENCTDPDFLRPKCADTVFKKNINILLEEQLEIWTHTSRGFLENELNEIYFALCEVM